MPIRQQVRSSWRAGREAFSGTLPPRYEPRLEAPFWDRVAPRMAQGVRVLDLGAGRAPVIPLSMRPQGCRYVGLDASAAELELAPADAYDDVVVADATIPQPELAESFDLIVSWHVLEHLTPMRCALESIAACLVPGGRFVAHFAGGRSAHSTINRLVPERVGKLAMERLLDRPEASVFEAHYDACRKSAMAVELALLFARFEIVPLYRDAWYFSFSRTAQALYLAYEEWAADGHDDLASHYVVSADR